MVPMRKGWGFSTVAVSSFSVAVLSSIASAEAAVSAVRSPPAVSTKYPECNHFGGSLGCPCNVWMGGAVVAFGVLMPVWKGCGRAVVVEALLHEFSVSACL